MINAVKTVTGDWRNKLYHSAVEFSILIHKFFINLFAIVSMVTIYTRALMVDTPHTLIKKCV